MFFNIQESLKIYIKTQYRQSCYAKKYNPERLIYSIGLRSICIWAGHNLLLLIGDRPLKIFKNSQQKLLYTSFDNATLNRYEKAAISKHRPTKRLLLYQIRPAPINIFAKTLQTAYTALIKNTTIFLQTLYFF